MKSAIIVAMALAIAPQQAARISGIVVTADATPQPVRRALVVLTSAEIVTNISGITDDQGRFDIVGVPPGRVTVTVSKIGHLTTPYGASRPGRPGTPLSLTAGQHLRDVRVRLPRGAVITGVIRDAKGDPVANLPVSVQRAALVGGSSGYLPISETLMTDDRGMYRAFGLEPGEYVVAGAPSRGRSAVERLAEAEIDATLERLRTRARSSVPATPAAAPPATAEFAPVFYPGTAVAAEAMPIRVAAGEERRGVDFVVDLEPAVTIRGQVATIDGSPLTNVTLWLAVVGPPVPNIEDMSARVGPASSGAFSFTNVPPGRYILTGVASARPAAESGSGAPQPRWAQTTFDVRRDDLSGVSLTLRPALSLPGRIEFERATLAPPTDLTTLRVGLRAVNAPPLRPVPLIDGMAADGSTPQPASVRADGRFEIAGIMPGRFTVTSTVPRPAGPSGWWLKGAKAGDRDLLDDPIEVSESSTALPEVVVTFTDRHSELAGSLQTAAGQPASEFFVIVFPTERRWWAAGSRRVRATRPASDGRFSLLDLPAGEYLVAALTDVEPDEWKSPAFLEQLVGAAVKVTIRDGERTVQDLRLR
jgi:hypothetical protein